jgi:hypothetical protein
MNPEKEYELWKAERARIPVPADFADGVMKSVHKTRQQAWRLVFQRLAMAGIRSRILRAGVCVGVVTAWAFRLGGLMTVFFPAAMGH